MSDPTCVGVSSLPLRRVLAALLATAALTGGSAVAATYRIVPLPLPADAEASTVSGDGLNNAGEIVGNGMKTGDERNAHAVAWSAALDYAPRWLPEQGADTSYARDINDAGYIAGVLFYRKRPSQSAAVMWRPDDAPVPLRHPPSAQSGSEAIAINGDSTILGNLYLAYAEQPVFWTTPARVRELLYDTSGFFREIAVQALNDSGVIVGSATTNGNLRVRAFRWTPGNDMDLLDDLPGFVNSYARDVNEAGEIAGYSYERRGVPDPVYEGRAVLWNVDGSPQDLGDLPGGSVYEDGYYANHINDAGVVVGSAKNNDVSLFTTFVWTAATGMQDIVDLIDPLDPLYPRIVSGELQLQIKDLNDAGVMVGDASSNQESIPIVLVPQS